ncbi:MAG: RNHCP domain-containing protein [bacterium]
MKKNFYGRGNDAFVCEHCNRAVPPLRVGGYRNHCPYCLYGKHVDNVPGDRRAGCQGLMKPIGLEQSGKKGWVIQYRCLQCGIERRNKAALDDPVSDNMDRLIEISHP